jgi:hypothetical protein
MVKLAQQPVLTMRLLGRLRGCAVVALAARLGIGFRTLLASRTIIRRNILLSAPFRSFVRGWHTVLGVSEPSNVGVVAGIVV